MDEITIAMTIPGWLKYVAYAFLAIFTVGTIAACVKTYYEIRFKLLQIRIRRILDKNQAQEPAPEPGDPPTVTRKTTKKRKKK